MYIIIGMIASASGICRVCMMQQMHPTNMLGMVNEHHPQVSFLAALLLPVVPVH